MSIPPGGERRPLFCVHPAGGNVLCYVPLAPELRPEQPFYALQSRGLESDEEPFTRIEEMAAHYLARLREVQGEGPYQLAGWSFGGLVAWRRPVPPPCRLLPSRLPSVGLGTPSLPPSVTAPCHPDA